MRFGSTIFAGLALLTLLAPPLRAGAYDPHQVPADVQWVIHVDVDVVQNSKLWGMLQKPLMDNPGYQMAIGKLMITTGISFPKDVHDVTLYGWDSQPDNGVVLVHATVDQQKLLALLTISPDFATHQEDGRDIYTWKTKGRQTYGAFAAADLTVIAHSQQSLDEALATLDGKNPPLEPDSALNAGIRPGVLLYLTGRNFASLGAKAAILSHIRSGWLGVSEEADRLVISASVTADDSQSAHQMYAGAEGVKALAELSAGDDNADPQAKDIAALVDGLNVNIQDQTITATCPIPLELIAGVIGRKGVDFRYDGQNGAVTVNPNAIAPTTHPAN